jgi:hypothetical protein
MDSALVLAPILAYLQRRVRQAAQVRRECWCMPHGIVFGCTDSCGQGDVQMAVMHAARTSDGVHASAQRLGMSALCMRVVRLTMPHPGLPCSVLFAWCCRAPNHVQARQALWHACPCCQARMWPALAWPHPLWWPHAAGSSRAAACATLPPWWPWTG